MKFDKLTMFYNDETVAQNGLSKEVDFRYCGDVGDCLKIYAQVNDESWSGSVTTKVQTSWDKGTWVDIGGAVASNGNVLYAGGIPSGIRRFIRLAITGTVNGKVTAGLVDTIESPKVGKIQTFPPLEDLTA